MTFSLSKQDRSAPIAPSRFLAARLRRGLTIGALAREMGLERNTIARYEAGRFNPAPEHLIAAARVLRFPPRFFLGKDIGELAADAASLRVRSSLTARQRNIAIGSAGVAIAFNQEAERFFALPEAKLPDYSDRDPERVADLLRSRWDIGKGPIQGLMPLLEEKGVRVFSLPADAQAADSFSMWHRDQPFIFLNTAKSVIDQRFDLAHELGHLLIHRHRQPTNDDDCREAAQFAAAFLMPPEAMRKKGDLAELSLEQLGSIATTWGLPPEAAARRVHARGILTDWKFRQLRTAINVWPEDNLDGLVSSLSEASVLLPKIFLSLQQRGITTQKYPPILRLYLRDIEEFTFGANTRTCTLAGEKKGVEEAFRPNLSIVYQNDH